MNNQKSLLLLIILIIALWIPFNTYAETQDKLSEAINTAGMQRMLSQRIVKAYLFHGMGVRTDKAHDQLEESLKLFQKNHAYLKRSISDTEIQDMLAFLDLMLNQYSSIVSKPYDKTGAAEALDLSETILESSNAIVKKLESMSKFKKEKIINISGRQRMLSQRIAKYYIAYQAGFRDKNTVTQLQNAVKEFEDAHKTLTESKQNTKQIASMISRVGLLWELVNKFFLDVEKGGLPVSVLTITDQILKSMDEVTLAYVNTKANPPAI